MGEKRESEREGDVVRVVMRFLYGEDVIFSCFFFFYTNLFSPSIFFFCHIVSSILNLIFFHPSSIIEKWLTVDLKIVFLSLK